MGFHVVTIGCNRPNLFQELVESLKKHQELENITAWAFFDGDGVTQQAQASACKMLENCTTYLQPKLGLGLNMNRVREFVFRKLELEEAFFFEDDCIPGAEFFNKARQLQRLRLQHDNIGAIQGWNENIPWRAELASQFEHTQTHWWGYSLTRYVYEKIAPFMLDFQARFLTENYSTRPHAEIMKYLKAELDKISPPSGDFPVNLQEFYRIAKRPATGQDSAMGIALLKEGLLKIAPYYSVVRNIGKTGVHMTESIYNNLNIPLINKMVK